MYYLTKNQKIKILTIPKKGVFVVFYRGEFSASLKRKLRNSLTNKHYKKICQYEQ